MEGIYYSGSDDRIITTITNPVYLTDDPDIAQEYGRYVHEFRVRGNILDLDWDVLEELGIDCERYEYEAVDILNSTKNRKILVDAGYSGVRFSGDVSPNFTPHDSLLMLVVDDIELINTDGND